MRPAGWVDRALVALLATGLLLAIWSRVAPFTTDSEAYLDVARNAAAGAGLVQRIVDFWRPSIPDPLGLWPPLFPIAVAAAIRLGLAPEAAARAVPAAAFLLFAVAFHALARRALGRAGALATTAIALATPDVLRAGATVWSEMPFLALATIGLLGLAELVEPRPSPSRAAPDRTRLALASGLAAGLAALTRYLGAVLIPVGAIVLMRHRVSARARGAWLIGAALPPALWAARNLAVFGNPTGPGLPQSRQALLEVAIQAVVGLRWALFPFAPTAAWPWVAIGWTVALAGVAGMVAALAWSITRRGPAFVAGVFAAVHLIALVIARSEVGVNAVSGRYLTPALPFLWLVAACAAAALARRRGVVKPAVVAVAAGMLAFEVLSLARQPEDPFLHTREEAIAELRTLLDAEGTPVLSDHGHWVRSGTGRSAVQIPGSGFRVREFKPEDETRWRASGVREAVLDRWWQSHLTLPGGHLAIGDWLGARIGSSWIPVDSTRRFVRYRLP